MSTKPKNLTQDGPEVTYDDGMFKVIIAPWHPRGKVEWKDPYMVSHGIALECQEALETRVRLDSGRNVPIGHLKGYADAVRNVIAGRLPWTTPGAKS